MTSSPAPDSTCYDCATNQTRLDTLDSEYVTLCEAIDALRTRLADLETRTTGLTTALGNLALSSTVHDHGTRLNALETAQRIEHRTMHATFNGHQARLEALEKQQREQSLVLVSHEQWLEALETTAPPPNHRHDGGFWIACPFCVDDDLGMCSACNGTRRIWEMPAEDVHDSATA